MQLKKASQAYHGNPSLSGGYGVHVTEVKNVDSFVPTLVTPVTITIAIRLAISAYSMAVAPPISEAKPVTVPPNFSLRAILLLSECRVIKRPHGPPTTARRQAAEANMSGFCSHMAKVALSAMIKCGGF